jgi:hypothetical protein
MVQSSSVLGSVKRHVVSVSLLALIASMPVAAEEPMRLAQVYPVYPGSAPVRVYRPVQPHEVVDIVRSLGLSPVNQPRPQGPVWVIRAIGQDGTLVRVAIDGRSGRVMDIVQIGPRAPRLTRIEPGMPPGSALYDVIEEPYDLPPRPPARVPGAWSGAPDPGPQIITREGIRSGELPPPPATGPYMQRNAPGTGPQVITRDPDSTGSVPSSAPRPVDPLNGVPPEFRRGASRGESAKDKRIASGTPADSIQRATPLPRPRPADVPALAKGDDTPAAAPAAAPAAKADTAEKSTTEVSGGAKKKSTDWPPVQPLE